MISLESFLARDKPPSIQIEGQTLVVEDTKFDISQLRLWVDSSLRILSTGSAVTLMKRRTAIKAFLDPQYHLLKMSNPITSELLGPNLDQKISELHKIHDVAKKLHFKCRNRGGSTAGRKFRQDNRSQFRGTSGHRYNSDFPCNYNEDSSKGYNSPKKRSYPRDSKRQHRCGKARCS